MSTYPYQSNFVHLPKLKTCPHYNRPSGCLLGARCQLPHVAPPQVHKRAEDAQPNEQRQTTWRSNGKGIVPPIAITIPKPQPPLHPRVTKWKSWGQPYNWKDKQRSLTQQLPLNKPRPDISTPKAQHHRTGIPEVKLPVQVPGDKEYLTPVRTRKRTLKDLNGMQDKSPDGEVVIGSVDDPTDGQPFASTSQPSPKIPSSPTICHSSQNASIPIAKNSNSQVAETGSKLEFHEQDAGDLNDSGKTKLKPQDDPSPQKLTVLPMQTETSPHGKKRKRGYSPTNGARIRQAESDSCGQPTLSGNTAISAVNIASRRESGRSYEAMKMPHSESQRIDGTANPHPGLLDVCMNQCAEADEPTTEMKQDTGQLLFGCIDQSPQNISKPLMPLIPVALPDNCNPQSVEQTIDSNSITEPPVKQETDLTEIIAVPRRQTEGAIFFGIVPLELAKFSNNRTAWAKSVADRLQSSGLVIQNIRMRDDGISIDWSSPIPVWSDTLLPATLEDAHEKAVTINDSQSFEERSFADDADSFVVQYLTSFEQDRMSLRQLYASDAVFSMQVHRISGVPEHADDLSNFLGGAKCNNICSVLPGSRNSQTHAAVCIGVDAILDFLLQLGSLSAFYPPDADNLDVRTDHLTLSETSLFTTVVQRRPEAGPASSHRLLFSHSLVLVLNLSSESCTEWPIIIQSHQMTVRFMHRNC